MLTKLAKNIWMVYNSATFSAKKYYMMLSNTWIVFPVANSQLITCPPREMPASQRAYKQCTFYRTLLINFSTEEIRFFRLYLACFCNWLCTILCISKLKIFLCSINTFSSCEAFDLIKHWLTTSKVLMYMKDHRLHIYGLHRLWLDKLPPSRD